MLAIGNLRNKGCGSWLIFIANFLFYKIVAATEAVKLYDHRTAVATVR